MSTQKPTTEKVKLLRAHRHGGKDHAEGDVIDVTPATRARLAARKIIATGEVAK